MSDKQDEQTILYHGSGNGQSMNAIPPVHFMNSRAMDATFPDQSPARHRGHPFSAPPRVFGQHSQGQYYGQPRIATNLQQGPYKQQRQQQQQQQPQQPLPQLQQQQPQQPMMVSPGQVSSGRSSLYVHAQPFHPSSGSVPYQPRWYPQPVDAPSPATNPGRDTAPLDEFILAALKKPQERIFLLKLEQDLTNFINNHQLYRLDLPQMNSYQRRMVHKVAPYFNLSHFYEHNLQSVCLYKNQYTALPAVGFAKLVEPEVNEPEVKAPKIQIMRRTPSGGNNANKDVKNSSPTTDAAERRNLTLEERKAKYEEARARIFKDLEEAAPAPLDIIDQTIKEATEGKR